MTPNPTIYSKAAVDQAVLDHRCKVLAQRNCGPNLWIITLETFSGDFICRAGQFVMLDLPDARFFFRRPFSVLKVSDHKRFDILYKVVGQGTAMMADFAPGQEINVLGPLGKPFPDISTEQAGGQKNILLLGGGIGIAPLACWLEDNLAALGDAFNPVCAFGARNVDELSIKSELCQYLGVTQRVFATDDGSYSGQDGFAGRIDQWLLANATIAENSAIAFICGPMPMMRACSEALQKLNPSLPVYVSLENHMPCGTGVCSGCAVFANDSLPIKVCLEGPVLNARRIDWANADGRQANATACVVTSAIPDAYMSPNSQSLTGDASCQQ